MILCLPKTQVFSDTEPAVGPGKVQRLGPAVDAQSSEQTPEVDLDGVFTDVELFSDVTVGQTLVEHQNQLLLTFGQFGGDVCGGVGFGGQLLFRNDQIFQ